ncbi:hypothetical protein EYF80_030161 [Liparis tanakae]|uniref:Uncharacterized protein n=1 Tax=Liparis tanakae TaxID=230148 RepID=A0A4Z2H1E4_9TELE|nr:hypothetical protein EYF80_030161 [Liparis tanakae]
MENVGLMRRGTPERRNCEMSPAKHARYGGRRRGVLIHRERVYSGEGCVVVVMLRGDRGANIVFFFFFFRKGISGTADVAELFNLFPSLSPPAPR